MTTHLIGLSKHTSLHHDNTYQWIITANLIASSQHTLLHHRNTPHCIITTHLIVSSFITTHLIASLRHTSLHHHCNTSLHHHCNTSLHNTPYCIIASHLIVLLKHTPPSLLTATLHRVSSSITYVLRVFFFVINAGLPLIHYRNLPPNNCWKYYSEIDLLNIINLILVFAIHLLY